MSDSLRIQQLNDLLVRPAGPARTGTAPGRPGTSDSSAPSFADALRQAQAPSADAAPLRFSAHAQTRIQSRQINMGPAEIERLQGAVERAATKGVRESLVMLDHTALVVSVPNRTVITVVDQDNLKQNVFTNIDGAVIA